MGKARFVSVGIYHARVSLSHRSPKCPGESDYQFASCFQTWSTAFPLEGRIMYSIEPHLSVSLSCAVHAPKSRPNSYKRSKFLERLSMSHATDWLFLDIKLTDHFVCDFGDQELPRLVHSSRRGTVELGAEDNDGLSQRACTALAEEYNQPVHVVMHQLYTEDFHWYQKWWP